MRKFFLAFMSAGLAFGQPFLARADEKGVWANIQCKNSEEVCQLSDLIQLLINAAQIILGLSGSFALLMFVYGGGLWLFSGGQSEQVEKGKKTLVAAVLGLAVVFLSWTIINFILVSLGYKNASQWFKIGGGGK